MKLGKTTNPPSLTSLSFFLDGFSGIYKSFETQKHAIGPPEVEAAKFLLKSMTTSLQNAKATAWNFDPWEVSGVGRDEMRNSQILAWLLNPRGSHGLGDVLLCNLLNQICSSIPGFPKLVDGYCSVRTEESPSGESSERIDIEIDCAYFYLLIEVNLNPCSPGINSG